MINLSACKVKVGTIATTFSAVYNSSHPPFLTGVVISVIALILIVMVIVMVVAVWALCKKKHGKQKVFNTSDHIYSHLVRYCLYTQLQTASVCKVCKLVSHLLEVTQFTSRRCFQTKVYTS